MENIEKFKDELWESLSTLIGKLIDDDLINKVKLQMKNKIFEILGESFKTEHFKIEAIGSGDYVEIIPKNLYTLLLLYNVPVLYEMVKDIEEWEDDGIKYIFKDGEAKVINNNNPIILN